VPTRTDLIRRYLELQAIQHGVDPALAVGQAQVESGLNPQARSRAGAVGIMQLMPGTGQDLGVAPAERTDPTKNIPAGVQYLRQQLDATGGDVPQALSRYIMGPSSGRRNPAYERAVQEATTLETLRMRRDELLQLQRKAASPSSPESTPPTQEPLIVYRGPSGPAGDALLQQPAAPSETQPAVNISPLTAGMTDEQIATALGYDFDTIQQSRYYQPGMFAQRLTTPGSRLSRVMDGLFGSVVEGGMTAMRGMTTALQRGLRSIGLANDADVHLAQLSQDLARADYQQNIRGGRPQGVGERLLSGVGQLAAQSPVMATVGRVLPGEPGLGPASLRGATYGAVGGMIAPTQGPAEPDIGGQAHTGATIGAVVGPVFEGLTAKVLNTLQGRRASPQVAALEQTAEAQGIPVAVDDLAAQQMPNIARLGSTLEQVPMVGMAGFRRGTQAAAERAAIAERDTALQTMQRLGYDNLPAIRHAAAGHGPRAREAQQVLRQVAEAGEDWSHILQASGSVALLGKKLHSDTLYNVVDNLGARYGRTVELPTALATAQRLLQQEQQRVTPDTQVIRILQKVQNELTTPAQPATPSRLLGPRGEPLISAAAQPATLKPVTYADARAYRSDLGTAGYLPNEPIATRGQVALRQVRRGVEEDLAQFVARAQDPALAEAAARADQWYRTQVAPYHATRLAKALRAETPADTVYAMFIKASTTPQMAQRFYEALDTKGRAAVQAGMLSEAVDAATHVTSTNPGGQLSPTQFAQNLQRIEDSYGVFFRGADRQRLDGLVQLFHHLSRAAQYAENPPTGNRVLSGLGTLGTGAGLATHPTETLASLGGIAGVALLGRTLLTSRAGKALLLSAASLPEQAPAWEQLIQRAVTLAGIQEVPR